MQMSFVFSSIGSGNGMICSLKFILQFQSDGDSGWSEGLLVKDVCEIPVNETRPTHYLSQ